MSVNRRCSRDRIACAIRGPRDPRPAAVVAQCRPAARTAKSRECQDANLCSADGFVGTHNMLLGRLLGRLQIRLPCIHRYAKVWICVGSPEITRVETHSVEPLRVFPLAKGVGVRENVATM